MNKIYKCIYNFCRENVVVVSETNKKKQKNHGKSACLYAICMCLSLNALAAERNYIDWVEPIIFRSTNQDAAITLNYFLLNRAPDKSLIIGGYESYYTPITSVSAEIGGIKNEAGYTLTIEGGKVTAISQFSGIIENSGNLTILGGKKGGNGISSFSGVIENKEGGIIEIIGPDVKEDQWNNGDGLSPTGEYIIKNEGIMRFQAGHQGSAISQNVGAGLDGKILNYGEIYMKGKIGERSAFQSHAFRFLPTVENYGYWEITGGDAENAGAVSDIEKTFDNYGVFVIKGGKNSPNPFKGDKLYSSSGLYEISGMVINHADAKMQITGWLSKDNIAGGGLMRLRGEIVNHGILQFGDAPGDDVTLKGLSYASIADLEGAVTNYGQIIAYDRLFGFHGDPTGNEKFSNKSGATVKTNAQGLFDVGHAESDGQFVGFKDLYRENKGSKTEKKEYSYTLDLTHCNFRDWVINYSEWEEGGSLVILDYRDDTQESEKIKRLFTQQFGEGTTISFEGKGGTEKIWKLTLENLKRYLLDGRIKYDDVLLEPIINSTIEPVETFELSNESIFNGNIGATTISGFKQAAVKDGYTLTILGEAEPPSIESRSGVTSYLLDGGNLTLGMDFHKEITYPFFETISLKSDSNITIEATNVKGKSINKFNDSVINTTIKIAERSQVELVDELLNSTTGGDGYPGITADLIENSGNLYSPAIVSKRIINDGILLSTAGLSNGSDELDNFTFINTNQATVNVIENLGADSIIYNSGELTVLDEFSTDGIVSGPGLFRINTLSSNHGTVSLLSNRIESDNWSADHEYQLNLTKDISGTDYGRILGWSGSWSSERNGTNLLDIQEGAELITGVFGVDNTLPDNPRNIGQSNNSGRLRYHTIINSGRIQDSETAQRIDGTTIDQEGSVFWLERLKNNINAVLDIKELRIGQALINDSQNLKLKNLVASKDANIQNTGQLDIDNIFIGVDSTSNVFTQSNYNLPASLEYTSGSGSFINEGAIGSENNPSQTLKTSLGVTNSGSINAKQASFTDLENLTSGSIKSTDIKVNGDFVNSGTVDVAGTLSIQSGETTLDSGNTSADILKISDSATVKVISGSNNFKQLDMETGSNLENSQSLEFDSLNNGRRVNYTQESGTINFKDGNWFEKSNLIIKGGKLTLQNLGDNTYIVSGTKIYDYKSPLDSDWKELQTLLTVDYVDSASDITLQAGSVLEAQQLNLTIPSLHVDGGAFTSSLSTIFEEVNEDVYTITYGEPSQLETKAIGASDVTNLKVNFIDNVEFTENGGTIVITDSVVSTKAISSASNQLKNINPNVNVVYTGIAAEGDDTGTSFYRSTFERLKVEQKQSSQFHDPGVIFAGMRYVNQADSSESSRKANLVIGDVSEDESTYRLDKSIGFASIEEAKNVTVQDNKTLALVGDNTSSSPRELVVNGSLEVLDGEVSLGSKGLVGNYTGTLAELNMSAADSKLHVKNGSYEIRTLNFKAGEATIESLASLNIGVHTDKKETKVENKGELRVNEASDLKGSYSNQNLLTVSSDTNTKVSGSIETAANAKTIFIEGFTLSKEDNSDAHITTAGRLISHNKDTIGSMVEVTAANEDGDVVGTYLADHGLEIVDDGILNNQANVVTTDMDISSGSHNISAGGFTRADTISIGAEGKLNLLPGSTIVLNSLSSDGTITVGNDLEIVLGELAVAYWESQNDNDEKIEAIKGDDWQEQVSLALFSIRRTNSLSEEDYLDKTSGFAASLPVTGEYQGLRFRLGGSADNPTASLPDATLTGNTELTGVGYIYVPNGVEFKLQGGYAEFKPDLYEGRSALIVNGQFTNESTLRAESLYVRDEGKFLNKKGQSNINQLDVRGQFVNSANLSAENVSIHDGHFLNNGGYSKISDLYMKEETGNLAITGGEVKVSRVHLEKGHINVESGLLEIFDVDDVYQPDVAIKEGANFYLGTSINLNDAILSVGIPELNLQPGDIYFGPDSSFTLDLKQIDENEPALIGKDGANLYVKEGSSFIVKNMPYGTYYVTDNLNTESMDEMAWKEDDFVPPSKNEAIRLDKDEVTGQLVLRVGVADGDDQKKDPTEPQPVLPPEMKRFALPRIMLDHLINLNDLSGVDRLLMQRVVEEAQFGSSDHATKSWNSVGQIGAASAMTAYAFDQASQSMGQIAQRLSAISQESEGSGLWAHLEGSKGKQTRLQAHGVKGGYSAKTYGLTMGADFAPTKGVVLGTAFNYLDGNLKSKGGYTKTQSKTKLYGGHLYVKKQSGKVGVSAQVGVLGGKGHAQQNFVVGGDLFSTKSTIESINTLLGLRADVQVPITKNLTIAPHVGVELIHSWTDDYEIKINGQKAFDVESDVNNVVQFPIGLAFNGRAKTNGWTIGVDGDISMIVRAGNLTTESVVVANTLKTIDAVRYEMAGRILGNLNLGVKATKGAHSLVLKYNGYIGAAGTQSHGLTAGYEYNF